MHPNEYARHEILLLESLNEQVGYTAKQAVDNIPTHDLKQLGKSIIKRIVNRVLIELEEEGLVSRLDTGNPVWWIRTSLGTKLLDEYKALGVTGDDRDDGARFV